MKTSIFSFLSYFSPVLICTNIDLNNHKDTHAVPYFIPPRDPEEKAQCGPTCPEIFPQHTQAHAQSNSITTSIMGTTS